MDTTIKVPNVPNAPLAFRGVNATRRDLKRLAGETGVTLKFTNPDTSPVSRLRQGMQQLVGLDDTFAYVKGSDSERAAFGQALHNLEQRY
jgi:hypothetical protein